jgi:citrate synthase
MLEACLVASVDHGVTPPSAQVALLVASVRGALEMVLAAGVGAITDVHGGAGAKAAAFFRECEARAAARELPLPRAIQVVIHERIERGDRIEGLGHRVHTQDPRRDILWQLADDCGAAGTCTAISKIVEAAFAAVRGMTLPVNVDGVIGAVVADLGLDERVAKALFVTGRVAGLAAHAFEEEATQLPMRRIVFGEAEYRGPEATS